MGESQIGFVVLHSFSSLLYVHSSLIAWVFFRGVGFGVLAFLFFFWLLVVVVIVVVVVGVVARYDFDFQAL